MGLSLLTKHCISFIDMKPLLFLPGTTFHHLEGHLQLETLAYVTRTVRRNFAPRYQGNEVKMRLDEAGRCIRT